MIAAVGQERLFLDIDSRQRSKYGELACGDRIVSRRSPDGLIATAALSDGLGSGIKANILATLTAAMAVRFAEGGLGFPKAADTMMRVLPTCSVREIGYATFSIALWRACGALTVVEMGNPPFIYLRRGKECEMPVKIYSSREWKDRHVRVVEIQPEAGDRVVLISDGISQSGMGSAAHPLGLRRSGCVELCEELLAAQPEISARQMSFALVERALAAEPNHQPADDMSCLTLHFRPPKRLEVIAGPPFHAENDQKWAEKADAFAGTKVCCGGTTAKVLARELGRNLRIQAAPDWSKYPPAAEMDGFALITEGIVTLTRAAQILEGREAAVPDDPASRLAALLRDHDAITFLAGTRVNEAYQDPAMPLGIELRRTVVTRLAAILRETYLKETNIIFT